MVFGALVDALQEMLKDDLVWWIVCVVRPLLLALQKARDVNPANEDRFSILIDRLKRLLVNRDACAYQTAERFPCTFAVHEGIAMQLGV